MHPIIPLYIELIGRANLGEGALDFKVYETTDDTHHQSVNPYLKILQENSTGVIEIFSSPHPQHFLKNSAFPCAASAGAAIPSIPTSTCAPRRSPWSRCGSLAGPL